MRFAIYCLRHENVSVDIGEMAVMLCNRGTKGVPKIIINDTVIFSS